MDEKILLATTTLNNLKHNNYDVADYKMCLKESKLCQRALEDFIAYWESVEKINLKRKQEIETPSEAIHESSI